MFNGSNLEDSRFQDTIIDLSSFFDGKLTKISFEKCSLKGALFEKAKIYHTVFLECNLNRFNQYRADFINADISDTSFDKSDLADCQFVNARIADTSFSSARLDYAIFKNTKFTNCTFSGASLANICIDENTIFDNCSFDNNVNITLTIGYRGDNPFGINGPVIEFLAFKPFDLGKSIVSEQKETSYRYTYRNFLAPDNYIGDKAVYKLVLSLKDVPFDYAKHPENIIKDSVDVS